ncbi:MAG: hypothetical protein QOJ11_1061 [Frankiales bacterium]|jgi:EAL domain-containing protein (putative c-di-GMP-specific phosphodiesterase class I)|nr:hypothetical protein [Frankiales bacterium]
MEDAEHMRRRVDAVLRNNSIQPVYQPVGDVTDLSTVGYEALSRFGDMGVRGPDQWFADGFAVDRGVELEWLAATMALDLLEVLPNEQFLAVNMSPATILHIIEQ